MQKYVLPVLLLILALQARAIDTLTVRQVYSFNVGDTMDFRKWSYFSSYGGEQTRYVRKIVTAKTYNTTGDTLIFSFDNYNFSSLTITNLDSLAIFYGSNRATPANYCPANYQFDTTTYPGFISNSMSVSCGEVGEANIYTQGIGRTYHSEGGGNVIDGYQQSSETLIYYSNGITTVGRPLEEFNGSKNIQYLPLPEECASWTREVWGAQGTPSPNQTDKLIFTEQIRTGDKYPSSGINYVELIYSCVFPDNPRIIKDSLIGYFFNDTINKTAGFTTVIGGYPSLTIFDGNLLPGANCTNGMVEVDSVSVNNQYRTRWYCKNSGGYTYPKNNTAVAGIGYLSGLIKVQRYYRYDYHYNPPLLYEVDGNLTCFSVCGQTLWPTASAANCAILTGLRESETDEASIKLYPTLNNGQFTVEWMDIHTKDNLQIFDITGRLVQQFDINRPITTCQMTQYRKGMYLWRAINKGIPIKEGKMVME